MHIASKITLILGALIFVGSIAGVAIAGMALTDAGYKEEVYVERSMGQTFTIQENKSWKVSILVIHPADCDTLELSIVDSNGEEVAPALCLLDGGQGNEEFVIVYQNITLFIQFYFQVLFIRRCRVDFNDTLIYVFLYVNWLLASLWIAIFDLVAQNWLFTLHVSLR